MKRGQFRFRQHDDDGLIMARALTMVQGRQRGAHHHIHPLEVRGQLGQQDACFPASVNQDGGRYRSRRNTGHCVPGKLWVEQGRGQVASGTASGRIRIPAAKQLPEKDAGCDTGSRLAHHAAGFGIDRRTVFLGLFQRPFQLQEAVHGLACLFFQQQVQEAFAATSRSRHPAQVFRVKCGFAGRHDEGEMLAGLF